MRASEPPAVHIPAEACGNIDLYLGRFSDRLRQAAQRESNTNCAGTALFLSGLEREDSSAVLVESSKVLSRCRLTDRIGPGVLLSWEHHPEFISTGARGERFVVYHMAIACEVSIGAAGPVVKVYHRPGTNRRLAKDSIENADLLDAGIFGFSSNYRLFAYTTPLLRAGLETNASGWTSCGIEQVRQQLERSRAAVLRC